MQRMDFNEGIPQWQSLKVPILSSSFDNQVTHLLQHIRLTRKEVEDLSNLFDDLKKTLNTIWPGCVIRPFGSIITGLGIKTSDVDCYVDVPTIFRTPEEKFVIKARNVMRRLPEKYSKIFAIATAKVPIVKFFHLPCRRYGDISFKNSSGVHNSLLIAELLQIDKRALTLTILVKYWSKVHKLTGTNLMPNYALILLVIFYLQQKDILPTVSYMQEDTPSYIVDNWNVAFKKLVTFQPDCDETVYQLLGGFFIYYSSLNFKENIISTFTGCLLNRNEFRKLCDIPSCFYYYKNNVRSNCYKPLNLISEMCVQDPFDHARNCTVGIYPKLSNRILTCFNYAAKMYVQQDSNNFLESILTFVPDQTTNINVHHQTTNINVHHQTTNIETTKKMKSPKFNKQTQFKKGKHNLQINLNALYQEMRRRDKQQ